MPAAPSLEAEGLAGAPTPDVVAKAVQADLALAPDADGAPIGEGPNPDEDAVRIAAKEQQSVEDREKTEEERLRAQDLAEAEAAAALMQPFEILIWFPARPLLPQHALAAGLPDTPSPLRCAVTPGENLNDLRATIQDSPEGYWLGAFCFRLRTVKPASTSDAASSSKKDKDQEVVTLGERLGEWVELSTVFDGIPAEERQLAITHVEYNEADARTHVQRLRELLHSGYRDPLALGIDAGITVLDAVRHPAEWENESNAAIISSSANGALSKATSGAAPGADAEVPHKASGAALFNDFAGPAPTDGSTLADLVPAHARPARYFPSSLRHLSVAAWSPPPHHLRIQAGHLLYLHIVTLEGETHFITACTRGFYVNRCTASKFDPSPRTLPKSNKPEFASCSLFDVLCALSPLFLTNFAKLFNDPLSARDYHAAIPCSNCLPAFPWLAREIPGSSAITLGAASAGAVGSTSAPTLSVSPTAAGLSHVYDPLRAQSAYLISGATAPDQLEGTRDWNDEIQSTREIPRATLPERLVRERVLNRAFSDFVMAAVRAVPRVAAGMVPAMNPMDALPAQMFIVNNLFISKGVDGVDLYPHLGGHEAAHVAVSKDVSGVRTLNALDIEGVCLLGTVVVDWMGERWVAQSVVPGLFRRKDEDEDEDEEAAGNGVSTKDESEAKDEADAPKSLKQTSSSSDSKTVDKASSKATPKKEDIHEDTQVIYGGVENPDVIRTHPGFHKIFAKVASALRLALHKVADGEGKEHDLWLSVESKGLRGADGRKYALDLARLNPVDILWLEQDVEGAIIGDSQQANGTDKDATKSSSSKYPHRMTLLRPELLEIFWDDSFRKWARQQIQKDPYADGAKDAKKALAIADQESEAESKAEAPAAEKKAPAQPERVDASKFQLAFNPDAFVEYRVPDPESMQDGEEDADAEPKTKVVVLVKDEDDPTVAAVRSAAKFLREVALPRLVTDVATGIYSAADGAHLTQQMHTRGINVRYLGYLAQLINPEAYTASAEEAATLKGKLDAEALKNAGPGYEGSLRCFESVVIQEMVVRAAKRLLRAFLRQVSYPEAANVVSHFLNCFLGAALEPKPTPVLHLSPLAEGFEGGVYEDATPSTAQNASEPQWTDLTVETLREQLILEVRKRFRFALPADFFERGLRKPQVLRELSLRCGLQLKLQPYKFEHAQEGADVNGHADGESKVNGEHSASHHLSSDEGTSTPTGAAAAAAASKKKNKKKKVTGSVSDSINGLAQHRTKTTTFEPEDVLNLVPVIKDSAPKSVLAEEAFEAGRLSLGRGDRDLGVDLLLEGINFHEQVYGIVHPEVSRCYSLFAMYVHHFTTLAAMENADRVRRAQAAGQDPESVELMPTNEHLSISNAVRYQRMAVTISERTLGLDNPETVTQYLNLAILERAEGNQDAALQCLNRVLELWNLIYGPNHVELVTVLSTTALTLQHTRRMEASLKMYQAAHSLALSLFGPDNIQVGNLTYELSQAYALVADLKTALQLAKECSRIFEARLGKDDPQTREADTYLSNLAASAVRHAKLEQEAKKREAKFAAMGIQVQPGLINRAAQMRLYGQGSRAASGTSSGVGAGPDTQARASSSASGSNSGSVDPSLSIDELVSYINSGSVGSGGGKGKGKSSAAAKKSRR